MGKNVGLTYVKDFSFPAEQGFTGSAGVHKVRGYMRGGHVKKCPVGKGGAKQKMPANVKAKGGTVHDKLKKEGGKMGYAYGGQVKPSNTSSQFEMKKGKQDSNDHGVQPAQKGRNEAEVEAGGNKRLKAGYREGGAIKGPKKGVHRVRAIDTVALKGLKKLKGVKSESEAAYMKKMAKDQPIKRRKSSGSEMPRGVKAKGGLMRYAEGGVAKKVGAAP